MQRPTIDLRSDTVTKPTPGMRRAMAEAEVGDDVFGDDPTVKRLEARTAELLGKEAALFVPSGTMANQIGIGVNTQPGDELLCAATSHVYVWEAGGIARLSGVTARTFEGDGGLLSLDDLRDAIRPADDVHYVRTRLVCLENTHNRGGGRIHPIASIAEIARWAREHNLAMHLDGARLMNAVVGSGLPAHEWARYFDTVSICFSKGLGAPIGSALAGSSDAIRLRAAAAQAFGRRDASGRHHRRRRPVCPRASRRSPERRPCPCPGPGGRVRRHRGLRTRIGPRRDQPGVGYREPVGGDRGRSGRLPELARHPGQRARAASYPGMYSS